MDYLNELKTAIMREPYVRKFFLELDSIVNLDFNGISIEHIIPEKHKQLFKTVKNDLLPYLKNDKKVSINLNPSPENYTPVNNIYDVLEGSLVSQEEFNEIFNIIKNNIPIPINPEYYMTIVVYTSNYISLLRKNNIKTISMDNLNSLCKFIEKKADKDIVLETTIEFFEHKRKILDKQKSEYLYEVKNEIKNEDTEC